MDEVRQGLASSKCSRACVVGRASWQCCGNVQKEYCEHC